MPPTVAPRLEVRRPGPPIRRKDRRHLGDVQAVQSRFHDHLGGELHAGGPQSELPDRLAREAAQSAMEVADAAGVEDPPDRGKHRVADVAVLPRHRPRLDAALEAVAHNEVVALTQLRQEAVEVGEVVGIVGVAHHHVAAAGRLNAAEQRRAVALALHVHDPRAEGTGDLLAAVGRTVVHDHHGGSFRKPTKAGEGSVQL